MSETVAALAPPRRRRLGWKTGALASLAVLGAGVFLTGSNCRQTSPGSEEAAARPETAGPPDTAGIDFADVTPQKGIAFTWPNQPRPMRAREAFGCGCAFFDYDNDGWLDVLLVADPHAILYRNIQGERFEDVSAEAGLTLTRAEDWIGCAVGDYDGDGWLDLLLTGFHRLALLRNAAGGRFEEVTGQVALDPFNHEHWGSSAGWMDLDGDGDLDLVVLNYVVFGPEVKQYCELHPGVLSGCPPREYEPEFGEIWRNNGERGFELIDAETSGMSTTSGVALVLAFTDYDDDNRMDFYIGNDGTKAEMMHNQGQMRFENVGEMSGLSVGREYKPMAAMGADWADFNRDGLLDLTVTDFQKNCFAIYRNEGGGFFLEVGNLTGITLTTCNRLGFGAKWIDMDNDRWPDISYTNGHVYDNVADMEKGADFRQPIMLFRSLEGRRFVDLVPALRSELKRPLVGRGSATGDFNNDGRLDLLVVDFEGPPMLLENRSQTPHHWLSLELRAAAPNVFAYGARVVGHAGGEVWISEVTPASSYLSSSDPRIHWGLGSFERLDKLVVRWPSGEEQTFDDVAADQFLRITEGQPLAKQPLAEPGKPALPTRL